MNLCEEMKNVDIKTVDKFALTDIKDIKIDTNKPIRDRILDFIRQVNKPGVTGLAQVHGWYLRPEEKIVYDIEYIKTRSLWKDFKIILKTVTDILGINIKVGKETKSEKGAFYSNGSENPYQCVSSSVHKNV